MSNLNFSNNEMIDFLLSIGYNSKFINYIKYENSYHDNIIEIPMSSQIFYKDEDNLSEIFSKNVKNYELENVFNKEFKNKLLKLLAK